MGKKRISVVLLSILLLTQLTACAKSPPETEPPGVIVDGGGDGIEIPERTDEEQIAAWVENSRTAFMAQSRELNGTQYLLVTYGMKNTGGYGVEITAVEVQEEQVTVTVRFARPAPGQNANQAIEYPFAMKEIPATGLPAVFLAKGDEPHVPHLAGIEYMLPVVVESAGIKVFAPAPNSLVERSFSVNGVANVFEGNIHYKLMDAKTTVLISGIGTTAMGDWQYFSIPFEVNGSASSQAELRLQLYTMSAKDGSVQDLVEIGLKLSE
jgi:hypothetical protein